MNKLVSPSQIFCEKCEEMVISLLKASDRQQSQSDEDGNNYDTFLSYLFFEFCRIIRKNH